MSAVGLVAFKLTPHSASALVVRNVRRRMRRAEQIALHAGGASGSESARKFADPAGRPDADRITCTSSAPRDTGKNVSNSQRPTTNSHVPTVLCGPVDECGLGGGARG